MVPRTAIGRDADQQGQNAARGDGVARHHIGKCRRTGDVVCGQLPTGVSAGLEVDAGTVHDVGKRRDHGHSRHAH